MRAAPASIEDYDYLPSTQAIDATAPATGLYPINLVQ
jgi:hypothetical protein